MARVMLMQAVLGFCRLTNAVDRWLVGVALLVLGVGCALADWSWRGISDRSYHGRLYFETSVLHAAAYAVFYVSAILMFTGIVRLMTSWMVEDGPKRRLTIVNRVACGLLETLLGIGAVLAIGIAAD